MGQRRFISGSREQAFLLPPDMREWLADDHLVWLVVEAIARCDTRAFEAAYRDDGQGRPAYDPAVLATLLVYAYAVGERSSRAIERRCREDVAFRVAAAGLVPDHVTVARFRRRHADALIGLFTGVLRLCAAAGLVRVGLVAIDGTRLSADASKDRFEPDAAAQVVSQILEEAERADASEELLTDDHQRALRGLAPSVHGADGCAARLDAAAETLTPTPTPTPAQASTSPPSRPLEGGLIGAERPMGGIAGQGRALAARRRGRRNLTDPESRLMRAPQGYVQGYNAQVAVDESHLIIACDVTQDGFDNRQLAPMVGRVEDALEAAGVGVSVGVFLADGGYWSGEPIAELMHSGRRLLVPPNGRPRTKHVRVSPHVRAMERRLRHPANRRRYRKRQALVEPVIAHTKIGRRFGRFQLRGLAGAQLEWSIACTAHNLARLAKHRPTA
jgi:transposase